MGNFDKLRPEAGRAEWWSFATQRVFLRFRVGNFLRLVLAKSRNCFSLIDLAICLEARLRRFRAFSPFRRKRGTGRHLLFP
jgi:hypothetical protein